MRIVALLFGVVFGVLLAWSQLSDPIVIQRMLLLREPDVFLLMGSAMAVAFIGLRALRHARATSFVGREAISWALTKPTRNHVSGSVAFGVGWSIASTCPGPLAVQLGALQVAAWFTLLGVLAGVALCGWQLARGTTAQERTTTVVAGL